MGIDSTIVRAAIHPGIGVARIGNSPDEYYVGPELTVSYTHLTLPTICSV